MAQSFTQEIIDLNRALITKYLKLDESSEKFRQIEKYALIHIGRSDSLYFGSRLELDGIVESLCNKFIFHGYIAQSKEFGRLYKKFASSDLSKHELNIRLNVLKFLVETSESPTNNLERISHKYGRHDKDNGKDIAIDWPKYLLEGIPKWTPNYASGDDKEIYSSDWSDDDENNDNDNKDHEERKKKMTSMSLLQLRDEVDDCKPARIFRGANENASAGIMSTYNYASYQMSKAKLSEMVQSRWFDKSERISFKPSSCDEAANLAYLWDDHVKGLTGGLLPTQSPNVISEYQVMREIMWQLHNPHTGSCFHFVKDSLIPRTGVTIASVREGAFHDFVSQFVPYIEWLANLEEFHKSVMNIKAFFDFTHERNSDNVVIPDTYKGYNFALRTIIEPVKAKLFEIEDKIKEQHETYTLLHLAEELQSIFASVRILNDIQVKLVPNFEENSPVHCVTGLLSRLYSRLLMSSSKLEQDICLTLYIHSLYKYFSIIDAWLVRDILQDQKDEFIISDNGNQGWQVKYVVKEFDEFAKSNHIIEAICTRVLQMGKNVHMLRRLRKLHLLTEQTGKHEETLYDTFVKKVLDNVADFFDRDGERKNNNIASDIADNFETPNDNDPTIISPATSSFVDVPNQERLATPYSFIFPVICPDDCKYPTEMDKLENLVDTDDSFLMRTFQSYFIKQNTAAEEKKTENDVSLFNKISEITKNLFPVRQVIDHVFVDILHDRFSVSGFILKDVLMQDYRLEKQFSFLKSIFLFKDDLIFPFYRRIFEQISLGRSWGNHTWLTSYLQDTIADSYPQFYSECTVEVKDSWRLCTDPLKSCDMINIRYKLEWPINVIILKEHLNMYKDLFGFIFKLKWALYTLNHLCFKDIRRRGKGLRMQLKIRIIIHKLETLRFGLINTLSSIHHYVLGHIYSKFSEEFRHAFESAHDLDSLVRAHAYFVQSLHNVCMSLAEYNQSRCGFHMLLLMTKKLNYMWTHLREVKDDDVNTCQSLYFECHKILNPIVT